MTAAKQAKASPKKNRAPHQFVRVTPTARNSPPHILLNAHHIDRTDENGDGCVLVMKSANGTERIEIGEERDVIEDAIEARAISGLIRLTEMLDGCANHRASFQIKDIRSIQQLTGTPHALIRFGHDGAGRFEAIESADLIAHMIEATGLITDWAKDKTPLDPQTACILIALAVHALETGKAPNLDTLLAETKAHQNEAILYEQAVAQGLVRRGEIKPDPSFPRPLGERLTRFL
jgi:hypothetical protein